MSTIDPSIACITCQIAAGSATNSAVDLSCVDCAVRHVMRTIEGIGKFGGDGHADRIKDRLVEKLIGEV